jgi:putative ABC transport system permease protein
MSLPNAKRLMPNQILGSAVGRLAGDAAADLAEQELQAYLTPKLRDAYLRVETARQLIAGMANQMHLFTLLLGAVGTLSLVLGGVGVMNIMLVSVAERKQEIGIRLAIGARRRDISALFLSEAVILAVVGGLFGIFLGLGASWVFAWVSDWEFILSPEAAPLGAGVSVLVGIFFGFYPAASASRLNPIDALRAD